MATVNFVGLTHHLKLMGLRPHYFKEDKKKYKSLVASGNAIKNNLANTSGL